MKFYISQVDFEFIACREKKEEDQAVINKLLNDYPCLKDKKFSFEIKEYTEKYNSGYVIDDEGNKLLNEICRTRLSPYINICTLEELIDLANAVETQLIIDKDHIEIYDGWRE